MPVLLQLGTQAILTGNFCMLTLIFSVGDNLYALDNAHVVDTSADGQVSYKE